MPTARRSIQSAVTIDGIPLVWHLHREQPGSDEGVEMGMCIYVRVAEGVRRELHMEYPVWVPQNTGLLWSPPPRPTIAPAKVKAHIREAIEAGWDPESRGKPFIYHVSELPN